MAEHKYEPRCPNRLCKLAPINLGDDKSVLVTRLYEGPRANGRVFIRAVRVMLGNEAPSESAIRRHLTHYVRGSGLR